MEETRNHLSRYANDALLLEHALNAYLPVNNSRTNYLKIIVSVCVIARALSDAHIARAHVYMLASGIIAGFRFRSSQVVNHRFSGK